jgi:hypothetical protein
MKKEIKNQRKYFPNHISAKEVQQGLKSQRSYQRKPENLQKCVSWKARVHNSVM